MKKLIAVLLAVALIAAALPFVVAHADTDSSELFIKTDGNRYSVNPGEIIDYVFYLNISDKITSMDAQLRYDTSALELQLDLEEYEEEYDAYAGLFPSISDIAVINYDVPGVIAYNVSRPAGTKSFNKDTSVLIKASFKVTAAEGTYEIRNNIIDLSGLDEHKYIYQGEKLDTVKRAEGVLLERIPQNPEPTQGPTQEPATQGPTQEPATQGPTQEPATQGPTQEPTVPVEPGTEIELHVGGAAYRALVGDEIEVIFYLNTGEKLCSLDGEFSYTPKALVPVYDEEEEFEDEAEAVASLFPVIGGAVVVSDPVPGYFAYNYSHPKGKNFNKNESELIRATFRVTGALGQGAVCEISNVLHTVAGAEERRFLYNDEEFEPLVYAGFKVIGAELIGGSEPTVPPAPTQAPTDPPVQPTSADSTLSATEQLPTGQPATESGPKMVLLKIDGVTYRVYPGEVIDYVYYINMGGRMCSIQADLFYPHEALEPIYEEDVDELFTIDVVANEYEPGDIRYNFSNVKGKLFDKNTSAIIRASFKVTATDGTYEINNMIDTLAGPGEYIFIRDLEIKDAPAFMGGTLLGKEPFDPENPDEPTEAPTEAPTDPPTEAPTDPPKPAVIEDERTGIMVETDLDLELTVDEIPAEDFRYFIANAGKIKVYRIALHVLDDDTPVVLNDEVKLMIPSGENGAVFGMNHTTLTDLSEIDLGAVYGDGTVDLMTKEFGLFFFSEIGEAPELIQYGDVDLDNEITILDATFIQRRLADIETFTEAQDIIGAVDTDGGLSILDATHIQRWLAGLDNELERFGYPKPY